MTLPTNLPEPREGYAWGTMSQKDASGEYWFTAREKNAAGDLVPVLHVAGHVCFQFPITDKTAVAFLKGKKARKVLDPTTGEDREISGAVKAAFSLAKHEAESCRGYCRDKAAEMEKTEEIEYKGETYKVAAVGLDDCQHIFNGNQELPPLTEAELDALWEAGDREAVKAELRRRNQLSS